MRHSKYLHYLSPVLILAAFLISSGFLGLLRSDNVHAASCASNTSSITTSMTSPSTQYPLCIGEDGQGNRYLQFAVDLKGKIAAQPGSSTSAIAVTGSDGNGKSIPFAQESDTRFVSMIGNRDRKLGWFSSGNIGGCITSSNDNKITINAKNVLTNKTQTFNINLCDYKASATFVILSADSFNPDGQAPVSAITSNLCINREDLKTIHPDYYVGNLQKKAVTTITVEGGPGAKLVGDSKSDWYDLGDGKLRVKNLAAGTYTVTIVYNDKLQLNLDSKIGDLSMYTTSELSVVLANIDVDGINDTNVPQPCIGATSSTTTPAVTPVNTCAVDGIGWIICPVMNFMGQIVDGAYSIVSSLLKTPPLNTNATDAANGTYKAWTIMRNIANVAFVIAFLIIIFSQLTSVGITNYGVKKMLPRIIIAAILVNLSYFICAIAVDISNILGTSMSQVFNSVSNQIVVPDFTNASKTGQGWSGMVGFLLAGGLATTALLYAGLSVVLPALITALAAIVTVFLVLTLRQALIIILIVVSPLAFVAFLLPNTEGLFKKWRELFQTLLLMFPIIAFIFGGSALASQIIMASDSASFPVQVMGALVAIIPLFITPVVMKSAGGLLNKFGGMVNNPNKGPFDRMRKGAEGYRKNRQEYRNLKSLNGIRSLPGMGFAAKRRASREAVLSNRKSEANRANADYISDKSSTDAKFRAKLAEGGGDGALERASAQALSIRIKLDAEEVDNAVKRMVNESSPTALQGDMKKMFVEAINSGDTTKARASQRILATQLGAPGVQSLHEAINDVELGGQGHSSTITELQKDINSMGLKGKDNTIASWGYSGRTIQQLEIDPKTFSGLNPTELAGQKLENLAKVESILTPQQAKGVLGNQNATQLLDPDKLALFQRIASRIIPKGTP